MSMQQGRAQPRRATLTFISLTATAIVMRASIASAVQLQIPAEAPQKPPPSPQQQPPTQTPLPITLMWEPPTENTNGSALVDLQAYRIYSGSTRGNLKARVTLRNPGLATYVLKPAGVAERYYAISAINSKGVESDLSNVVDRSR